MPTPSSNPPPDPSHPVPYNFSTCPEDVQHANATQTIVQNETRSQSSTREPSPESHNNRYTQLQETELSSNPNHSSVTNDSSQSNAAIVDISLPRVNSSAIGLPSPAPSGSGSEVLGGQDSMTAPRARDSKQLPDATEELKPLLLTREIELLQMSPLIDGSYIASDGPEFSTRRAIPISPSSFLRPGSKFHGSQQSERQVYDVQVEIKFVDLRESFLCGYLRIQGLTEDHPTLTTYFEGEIIGSKYSFFTQHDDWGANPTVDLNHWGKFSAFRQFYKCASRSTMSMNDVAQKENIFMRWKEHFLVPDHRVRTITGASFEGFYYICFNQLKGEVSGIYFHSKSEKFQQLELRHVPDKGCFNAMELR